MMEDPIGQYSIVSARAEERIARGQSGYFTMQGVKEREQLVARFRQLQQFLGPERKASSLTEWRKTYAKIVERLGGEPDKDFWKAYRTVLEKYPSGEFPGGYTSKTLQRMMMDISQGDYEWEELAEIVKNILDNKYEEEQKKEKKNDGGFFKPTEQ